MKSEPFCNSISRRSFMAKSMAGITGLTFGTKLMANTDLSMNTGLPQRPLGKTGINVSILGLGGWHIRSVKEDREAYRMIDTAINEGLTFFDNSWDYHDGASEELVGNALQLNGLRNEVFLMTKVCNRDYQGAMSNLEDSLRRFKTDHIDLWQFHEIIYDNDPDWVFEKGGIRAAIEAKKAGKVRFIGFTGHKDPSIHLKMLGKEFEWDAVQMPINVMDAQFRSFQHEVVPVCRERNMGMIGMKSLGGSGASIPSNTDLSVETCIRYSLSQPISTLVSGISSMKELLENINIARNFTPLTPSEQEAILRQYKEIAGDGRLELFKTTQRFDGGHHRRQHGFDRG